MIGWFALSVPSGLTLYWFTNNLVTTAQQVYLRKSFEAKQAAEAAAGPVPDGAGVIDVEGTYVKPKELGGGAPAKPSGRETGARKRRADGGGSDASDAEDGAAGGAAGGGEESAGARGERFRALKAREAAARARALAEPAAPAAPAADGALAVPDAPPAKDGGGAAGGAKKVVKKTVKRR
jgi:YidC/Oxa1 family membrane protein insertase